MNKFIKLINDETGATLIEYCLLASVIALACIVSMVGVSSKIATQLNTVGASIGRLLIT